MRALFIFPFILLAVSAWADVPTTDTEHTSATVKQIVLQVWLENEIQCREAIADEIATATVLQKILKARSPLILWKEASTEIRSVMAHVVAERMRQDAAELELRAKRLRWWADEVEASF